MSLFILGLETNSLAYKTIIFLKLFIRIQANIFPKLYCNFLKTSRDFTFIPTKDDRGPDRNMSYKIKNVSCFLKYIFRFLKTEKNFERTFYH